MQTLSFRVVVGLFALAVIVIAPACNESPPEISSGLIGQVCIANSLGVLQRLPKPPPCSAEESSCRDACLAGDPGACLSRAYAVEKKESGKDEAILHYQRSCLLGSAVGCTNYAAHIWATPHTSTQHACARRIFDKACGAKESFACGMIGRLMLEDPTTADEITQARKHLEAACDELEGFPCRVLAKHLESGKIGAYDSKVIHTLLKRACAGGDGEACGEPATAAETFRSAKANH